MNHVMAIPSVDLWQEHRRRTRDAIVRALVAMLNEENPASISMPKVAARAGVSTRTLYRYFPDKEGLVAAASGWFDDHIRAQFEPELGDDALRRYLRELWATLADHVDAVRVQHTGGAGRQIRMMRLQRNRDELASLAPPTLPDDERAELIDLIVALTSSSMMLELVDRMGHTPQRAADLVSHVVDLVIADAERARTDRKHEEDHP